MIMGYVIDNDFLMDEWNWEKNSKLGLCPEKLTCGSNKRAWWVCSKGHEWETTIVNKSKGSKCPYCTRSRVLEGFNDLLTTNPKIAAEWNYEKNGDLLPTMVLSGSDRKVWWICENGHEWYARIDSRTHGSMCPVCKKENKISINETRVYYYMHKYFPDSIWTYTDDKLKTMELDVFIPSLMTAIEYDGRYWHQDIDRDRRKDELCYNLGIKLIRIREPGCPKYKSTCDFIYLSNRYKIELKNIIENILDQLGIKNHNIDFDCDMQEIEDLVFHRKRDRLSLLEVFPEIAAEWHPVLNGCLKPENVTAYSNKKVWWKCVTCNHEWMAVISDRAYGRSCPKCAIERQKKKVYCIELNKIFPSMLEASSELNIYRTGISQSCNKSKASAGKHPITNKPLHWLYVEDQIKKDNSIINGAITLGYITQQQFNDYLNNQKTIQN